MRIFLAGFRGYSPDMLQLQPVSPAIPARKVGIVLPKKNLPLFIAAETFINFLPANAQSER